MKTVKVQRGMDLEHVTRTKYSTLTKVYRRTTNREEGGVEGGADLIVEPAHLISYKYVAQQNFLTIMK